MCYFLFSLTRPLFKTRSYIFTCKIWNIAYMTFLSANQIAYIFRANDKIISLKLVKLMKKNILFLVFWWQCNLLLLWCRTRANQSTASPSKQRDVLLPIWPHRVSFSLPIWPHRVSFSLSIWSRRIRFSLSIWSHKVSFLYQFDHRVRFLFQFDHTG